MPSVPPIFFLWKREVRSVKTMQKEGVKQVLFRENQAVLHRLKMKLKRLLSHRPGSTTSASRMTTLALAA